MQKLQVESKRRPRPEVPQTYQVFLSEVAGIIDEFLQPGNNYNRRQFAKELEESVNYRLQNTQLTPTQRRKIRKAMEFLIEALLHPYENDTHP